MAYMNTILLSDFILDHMRGSLALSFNRYYDVGLEELEGSEEDSRYWGHPQYEQILNRYELLDVVYGINNLAIGSIVVINSWSFNDGSNVLGGRSMLDWITTSGYSVFLMYMGRSHHTHRDPMFIYMYGEGPFPEIIDDLPNTAFIRVRAPISRYVVRSVALHQFLLSHNHTLFMEYMVNLPIPDPNLNIIDNDEEGEGDEEEDGIESDEEAA